jgi:hypothetical protein
MAVTTHSPSLTSDPQAEERERARRTDDVAGAFFSTWVVVGLFIDGWAHNAGKPEDFWTPWHALLYSGFVAGMITFGTVEVLRRRRGLVVPGDRPALAGVGLFAVAGAADMAWHTAFGVEEDLEALLSPSHLLLMGAGLLLVTAPVRGALGRPDAARSLRAFAPAAVGVTLAVAVTSFFLQFASALHVADPGAFAAGAGDRRQALAIAGVLVSTALLSGAVVWVASHWPTPPSGTFTLVFGAVAVLMAALGGVDELVLAVPVAAGGALADALLARRRDLRLVATVVPMATWAAWLATFHATRDLGWPAELIAGTVVLAGLVGYAVTILALVAPLAPVVPASVPAPGAR